MRYAYEFIVEAGTSDAARHLPMVPRAEIAKAMRRRVPRDAWIDDRGLDRFVDDVVAELDRPNFGPDQPHTQKGAEVVDVAINVPILKVDAEQRLVTGVVLEPTNVVGPDTQGDVYSAETIAETADRFMLNSQKIGLQHREAAGDRIRVVRSWIAPNDEVIGGQPVVKGSWLMTVKVFDDDLWAATKAGKYTGFSIGGRATRTPRAA